MSPGAMGLFVIAGLFVPAVAAGASGGAPPATPSAVFQSLGQSVVNATLSDFQIAGVNYLAQSANPISGGGYQSSGSAAYAWTESLELLLIGKSVGAGTTSASTLHTILNLQSLSNGTSIGDYSADPLVSLTFSQAGGTAATAILAVSGESSTPEPATFGILAVGFMALCLIGRRRKEMMF